MMHAAPTVSGLMASSESRPGEESRWSRFYQWQCPACRETFVGRSQPRCEREAVTDHAAFAQTFCEYVTQHLKGHVDA